MYLNIESVFFFSCFYYISQYEIKTISIIDDFSKNNIEMVLWHPIGTTRLLQSKLNNR